MKVITLCGSTKFKEHFQKVEETLTLKGMIVISLGFFANEECGISHEQELLFEEMHKRKIDMADEILVVNVNGYIGASTSKEIEYAKKHGKKIRYYTDMSF